MSKELSKKEKMLQMRHEGIMVVFNDKNKNFEWRLKGKTVITSGDKNSAW